MGVTLRLMAVIPQDMTKKKVQVVTDPIANGHVMAEWAIQRLDNDDIKTVSDLGPYRAFGVVRQQTDRIEPMAVVIFNWFRELPHGNDMRVIVVSEDPHWCLPGILRELFSYPFEIAGCERLTACIKDTNQRSLKLCQGLGFRKEGVLRRAYDGKANAIVLGLLKQECKWLRKKPATDEHVNGQEVAFATKAAGSGKNSRRSKRRKQRSAARERAH